MAGDRIKQFWGVGHRSSPGGASSGDLAGFLERLFEQVSDPRFGRPIAHIYQINEVSASESNDVIFTFLCSALPKNYAMLYLQQILTR